MRRGDAAATAWTPLRLGRSRGGDGVGRRRYNFIHAHEDVQHALKAGEVVEAGAVRRALLQEVAAQMAHAKATIGSYPFGRADIHLN